MVQDVASQRPMPEILELDLSDLKAALAGAGRTFDGRPFTDCSSRRSMCWADG